MNIEHLHNKECGVLVHLGGVGGHAAVLHGAAGLDEVQHRLQVHDVLPQTRILQHAHMSTYCWIPVPYTVGTKL